MKKIKLISFYLFVTLILSCSKGDDSPNNNTPINRPPINFSLLEVPNNAVDVSINPELTWERSTDPDGDSVKYQLLMDKGQTDPSTVLVSDLQNASFTVNATLEINTLYSWKVVASDGNDGLTNSETFTFITRGNISPNNFSLLEVSNGQENIVLNPELKWETAIDPDGDLVLYDLHLNAGTNAPVTVIAKEIQSTSFEIPDNLDYNTTYSWQVIASDDKGNSIASEIFSFSTRKFQETLVTSNAAFSTRTEHSLIEFNGKLWVIGGYHAANGSVNGGLLNDVWSSTDGVNWTEVVPNNSPESFIPREDHTTVVFQNKIWVIGGGGINGLLNDVWSSPDGITWTQETDNAGFVGRRAHISLVFNDRIWMIGGEDGNFAYNDVWSSSDGIEWEVETNNAAFSPRFMHSSAVFQEKIWVIGGINSNQGSGVGNLNDVWSSSDGVSWSIETVDASFSPRRGHSTAVYKNRLWVIAGNLNNDLWSSEDGINWNEETEVINFSGRGEQANLVYDDKLWIVGGWRGSLLNDVWFFD
ncbi:MAG: hypothetical protein RIM83_17130 [Allomuricauda sp.]